MTTDQWRTALAVAINPQAFENAAADIEWARLRGKPLEPTPRTLRALGEAYAAADRVNVLVTQ